MHTFTSIEKTQTQCAKWQREGLRIGFVPTMGCLHDGHLSLIKAARKDCDRVVVSIFVNPLQFGKNEDFGSYPRPLSRDLTKCEAAGADLVFHPSMSDFYTREFATRLTSGPLGKLYCGKSRPGFFDGVLTVVSILFHIVTPKRAYFGEKDFQQLFLIKQMVRDLRFAIDIVGVPTVREADGLAMSSRNEYLRPEQREEALCLYRAICSVKKAFQEGEHNALVLRRQAEKVLGEAPHFKLDYAHIVDERTLLVLSGEVQRRARLLLAGYLGDKPRIRLIDNASVL